MHFEFTLDIGAMGFGCLHTNAKNYGYLFTALTLGEQRRISQPGSFSPYTGIAVACSKVDQTRLTSTGVQL